MQEKMVDYTLCKRLDELRFECETHTGWYNAYTRHWHEIKKSIPVYLQIKAYDCWDLLMWLMCNQNDWRLWGAAQDYHFVANSQGDDQPQNALAKAVIKILEEQNDGQ